MKIKLEINITPEELSVLLGKRATVTQQVKTEEPKPKSPNWSNRSVIRTDLSIPTVSLPNGNYQDSNGDVYRLVDFVDKKPVPVMNMLGNTPFWMEDIHTGEFFHSEVELPDGKKVKTGPVDGVKFGW